MSCHRGIATLNNLILVQNFIWYNIFKDVKNYIYIIVPLVSKLIKII